MDYQELEAFMKLPEAERERRTVQDLWETKEGVREISKLLSSESCPHPACPIKEQVTILREHERIVIAVATLGILGSGVLVWTLTRIFGG